MNKESQCQILSTQQTVQVQVQPDVKLEGYGQNINAIQCRICLQEHGLLIVPCKCDGTMKYVHEVCLKRWASGKIKKQVQKQQEMVKGQLCSIHGVLCQLCKQNIAMEVKKMKKILGCKRAKQQTEQYFLPFLPLVIINVTLLFMWLCALIFTITFSIMVLTQNQSIDFRKYIQNPLIMWSLILLSLIFSSLFMVKSMIQLYHVFVQEEYEVVRILASLTQLTSSRSQSVKTTLSDYYQLKQFNQVDSLFTSPMPNDSLSQNKLSLTRKRMSIKRQTQRQIAQRRIQMIKQQAKHTYTQSNQEKQISMMPIARTR